jgi:hypothetical protein
LDFELDLDLDLDLVLLSSLFSLKKIKILIHIVGLIIRIISFLHTILIRVLLSEFP